MKPPALLPLCLCLLAGVVSAADPVAEEQVQKLKASRSAQFRSEAIAPRPVAQLPAHVPAPADTVSLFADFANRGDRLVVALYLINRTNTTKTFGSEGLDLGITLEYKENTTWRRAQALPPPSFCGDGHILVPLPAGHFFQLRGYRAATGFEAPVRYALAGQHLTSNEAVDLVSPGDLEAVAWDHVTEAAVPFEVRSLLHFCPDDPTPDRPSLRERTEAVTALARHSRSEVVTARVRRLLDHIISFPPGTDRDALRKAAAAYLERIEAPPASARPRTERSASTTPADLPRPRN